MRQSRYNSKYKSVLKWSLLSVGALLLMFMAGNFFLGRASEVGILFEASTDPGPKTVGEPVEIRLLANNDSDNLLKDVTLSLLLPVGAIYEGGDDRRIVSRDIGNIRPGEIKEEKFKVVILPVDSAGSTSSPQSREFSATMQYKLGTLTANFEKSAPLRLEVGDFPFVIDITAPEKVFPGEEFEIKAKYKNMLGETLPDLKLSLEHQDTFKLISMSPKADGEGIWNIDSLSSDEEGELTIKGIANSRDGDMKLAFITTLALGGSDYEVSRKEFSFTVEPSPISLEIKTVGDISAYRLGETIRYIIDYRNEADEAFQNAIIKVKLNGEMYDFGTLSVVGASFSAVTRTITWSPSQVQELRSIDSGAGGSLEFSINVKKDFLIRRISDKNYTVEAEAKIESTRIESSSSSNGATIGLSSIESKIAGALLVEAIAYFRDAPSLILNDGLFPPRVGMPTDFTIHWRIGSYSTNMSNLEVRARLAEGVILTGKTKSTNESAPAIDITTGEIVWKIGNLSANIGILNEGHEVIFQVRATPTSAMVGSYMTLLQETKIKATDDFSGLEITSFAEPVTTRLPEDTTVGENEGKVTN